MMQCARCHEASYCDGECQRAHWAAHRAYCMERAAAKAAEKAKPSRVKIGNIPRHYVVSLQRGADAGDAVAMMKLAMCHQHGMGGLCEDAAEAVHWYTRATEAPNPPPEVFKNLAECYSSGTGVRKNLTEAARLYRVAGDMGNACAQYSFAHCLQRGEGMQYNPEEAFKWYMRAADKGHSEALCNVGYAFEKGLGVPEDKAKGIAYYRRAANLGNGVAMYNLGGLYMRGEGLPRDMGRAVECWMHSRDAGYAPALKRLAELAGSVPRQYRETVSQLLATPMPRTPAPAACGCNTCGAGAPLPPTRADVLTMDTASLKRLLQSFGVDTAGVLEKTELVELVLAAIGEAPR